MSFFKNLSNLIRLTFRHGSGNVVILLRNDLEEKVRDIETELKRLQQSQKRQKSEQERLLAESKADKSRLNEVINSETGKLRQKSEENEVLSLKIQELEIEIQRLLEIEQLAKSLDNDFKSLIQKEQLKKNKIDDLLTDNQRLTEIEALAKSLESDYTKLTLDYSNLKSNYGTLNAQLQSSEQIGLKKDGEIHTLNQRILSLENNLRNEAIRFEELSKKHDFEKISIKKEVREETINEFTDAVIKEVVPIIKSNANPIPDRILFDEISEKNQKYFIEKERLEANKIYSEIQIKQAQQEAMLEKGLVQIREEKFLVNYGLIQNELLKYELTMKDFIQNKQVEFMKHEIAMQTYMVEMSKNVVIAEGRLLESEKNKMMVLEQVAQMGIEIKKQEVFLEKSLLIDERLRLDSDKQSLENQKQIEQIKLDMERFGLEKEYSKNMLDLSRKELDIEKLNFTGEQFQQNVIKVLTEFRSEFEKGFLELDKAMLNIEKGNFSNQAESAKLELQEKYLDVQNQLRGLSYERQYLDLSYREREVDLGEEYNRVQEQILNNERIMDKINFERKELDSQSKIDDMKFRFKAAMDDARYQYQSQLENSRNQMASQQHRLEQEAMRNSSLQLQNAGLKETISSLYRYNRNK